MKKTFLFASLLAATSMFAADTITYLKTTVTTQNVDEIKTFLSTYKPSTTQQNKHIVLIKIKLYKFENPKASFTNYKSELDNYLKTANLTIDNWSISLYNWWQRYNESQFANAAYNFFSSQPLAKSSYRDFGYLCFMLKKYDEAYENYTTSKWYIRATKIAHKSLKSPTKTFSSIQSIANNNTEISANQASYIVDTIADFIVGSPDISESDIKSVLKTFNRKFSVKLLTDKTSWEPVVAKIRTLLETF